jgi:hypothetical protein
VFVSLATATPCSFVYARIKIEGCKSHNLTRQPTILTLTVSSSSEQQQIQSNLTTGQSEGDLIVIGIACDCLLVQIFVLLRSS